MGGAFRPAGTTVSGGGEGEESEETVLGDTDRGDLLFRMAGAAVAECVACRGGGRWTAVAVCSLELIRVRLQWGGMM